MKCRGSKIGYVGCDLPSPLICTLCSMPSINIKPYMNSNNVWCKKTDTHLLLYIVANVYPFFASDYLAVTARIFVGPLPLKWPSSELRIMDKILLKITHSIKKSKALVVSILRWSQQPSFFAANNSLYPKAPYVTCIWQWKN